MASQQSAFPEQEFYNMKDEQFQKKLDSFLTLPYESVPVTYDTEIQTPDTIHFERTRLIPKAAVEHAQKDSDFAYQFAHSIAWFHRREMIQLAQSSKQMACQSCGRAAINIVQAPMCAWQVEPLVISDAAAIPLCSSPKCDQMAKQKFMGGMDQMEEFLEALVQDKTNPHQRCGHCAKMGDNLLRCSRCKNSWYCNKECQRTAWKQHKKVCYQSSDC